ncbi:DUF3192 domain-containing protein [Aliikangiella sp. G2MR2-5]|uniref:DUF3192 domain-containing protein n=1 Tax=Aliikangiella sp. G2MR2-5 TaxID=2788943 RepID=UPI0018AA77CB|nr:DUF3192 domain-containing protein [Aliikangiella sp. G2MR2-5]
MKNWANLIAASALTFGLTGCIVVDGHDDHKEHWKVEQKENRQIISNLSLETSRSQVLELMGAPAFSEAFAKGNDEYRVLYYRTQHRHSDGDTTIDETTPLVFKNDRLVGWGNEALARNR